MSGLNGTDGMIDKGDVEGENGTGDGNERKKVAMSRSNEPNNERRK